ncbi:hypothetical protein [Polaromonas sp.]|uniref:hypothetical protein n=1 Tax=Polaromonas sp. TaxID=1869339 RepID=UPI0032661B49
MNRRSFLASMLAARLAPAAVATAISDLAAASFVGLDMASGPDVGALFVGEVGEWHGIRIILTAPPSIQIPPVVMQKYPIFMHPHDDFYDLLKGAHRV